MPTSLRILLAILAGAAGLSAIYVIQKPESMAGERALALGSVTTLMAVTLLSTVWERMRAAREAPEAAEAGPPPASPAPRAEPPPEGSEVEIARLVALLRTHAEANAGFSRVLGRAQDELAETLKIEQVRLIIAHLIAENEKMRGRSDDLKAGLERSQRQIEGLKTNLATLEQQGMSDPLTGLRNRRSLDVVLASQVAAARSAGLPLSLILADIDHFKAMNDRYGHPVGDEVLKWFAKILSANVKGRDTVARYGGEEFAIVMPQTSLDNAASVAQQIRGQLETQLWQKPDAPNMMLRVTASFGAAQLAEGEGTSGLLARADRKLYEAKAAGRNRVVS